MLRGSLGTILAVLTAAGLGWAQTPGENRPASLPAQTPATAPDAAPDEPFGDFPTFLFGPDSPDGLAPRLPAQEASADPFVTWARAEYLFAWVKEAPAPPPLVTTGPPVPAGGVLGQPGTVVLIGDESIGYGTFAGCRLAVGSWFDLKPVCGFEVTGLVLEQRTKFQSARSDQFGSPVIGRPIISAQDGTPLRDKVAFPDEFAGGVVVAGSSHFWGLDVDLLHNTVPWRPWTWRRKNLGDVRAELRAGFRYLGLHEELTIDQTTDILIPASFGGAGVLPPATEVLSDGFNTRNQFWGGQVGGKVQFCRGRTFVDLLGKFALGTTHQVINVTGSSTLLVPGFQPAALPGALLATTTNIGRFTRDEFAVVPEVNINLGYQLNPECRVYVGYSFLYWSRVVRPQDQIDPVVNVTQIPIHEDYGPLIGPARPLVPFRETDFWMQGVNLGVEVRF